MISKPLYLYCLHNKYVRVIFISTNLIITNFQVVNPWTIYFLFGIFIWLMRMLVWTLLVLGSVSILVSLICLLDWFMLSSLKSWILSDQFFKWSIWFRYFCSVYCFHIYSRIACILYTSCMYPISPIFPDNQETYFVFLGKSALSFMNPSVLKSEVNVIKLKSSSTRTVAVVENGNVLKQKQS